MFFSKEQIEQSVATLSKLNPFFGTVFLAFKKAENPVNSTKNVMNVRFVPAVEDILQTYYCPTSDMSLFYIPFRASNKRKSWGWTTDTVAHSLLLSTVNVFADVLINPDGGSTWEWHTDYIENIKKRHLKNYLVPTFDLAVWLFRSRSWEDNTQFTDVIETFFSEFHISKEEQTIFDTSPPSLSNPWLQRDRTTNEDILSIIGSPPPKQITVVAHEMEVGATLELLKTTGFGPANQLECEFAPRLNLITGDNGLGKTFLLECAWWALTGNWSGYEPYPHEDASRDFPSITFQISKESQLDRPQTVKYNWNKLGWNTPTTRFVLPGLAVFAQADEAFAVWDPSKHLLHDERPKVNSLITFSREEIWNGKEERQDNQIMSVCNGLIRDWVTWQSVDKDRFREFSTLLERLSPDPTKELLIPGPLTKLPLDDRYIPTLEFPYGNVPIVVCSAGIQRILALAYLLVWSWNAHVETSKLMRREPTRTIVLLIDEMEAHLHPLWQRVITPALMNVVKALDSEVETQLIIATHSPLVLASVEPLFNDDKDKLFHLYQDENGSVFLDEVPFITRGRVDLWLTSNIFGLKQPRSKVAEDTIERAKALQREKEPLKEEVQEVSEALSKVLAPDDQFWPRWTYFAEREGVEL